jgi:hypothetical protein
MLYTNPMPVQLKVLVLLPFLFWPLAYAQDIDCPSPSFRTDFRSPISGHRRVFCSKRNAVGEIIQHGPEVEFDERGELIARRSFQDGAEVAAPAIEVIQEIPAELPASGRDFGFMRTAMHELLYVLIPIKRPPRESVALFHGGFATDTCTPNRFALTNFYSRPERKDVQIRLRYNDRCALQGELTLIKAQRTPMSFEARLSHYERIEGTVLIEVQNNDEVIKINFQLFNGRLFNPRGHLEFEASYELSMNSSGDLHDSHGGQVRIRSEAGVPINQELPLKLQITPERL